MKPIRHALEQSEQSGARLGAAVCPTTAKARDRTSDVVQCTGESARGMFPLWPVNRLFAGFAGTGGAVERMLRDCGIEPGGEAALDDWVAPAEVLRILRRTMRLTRDELWGLRPAPTRLGTFAQACRHAVAAPTVEQGLRAAFRYYHGLVDDFTLRLSQEGDKSRITLVDHLPDRPGRDSFHVIVLQVLRETIEWLSGRTGFIERVDYQFALPHDDALKSTFRAPFLERAARTGLVVSSAVLGRAVLADGSQVRGFVHSLPGKLALVVQGRRSIADRAASFIRARGDWDVGRDELAAAFDMSAATFARRLHEDIGVGFQELKDRLRCAAALELMAADGLALEQVAQAVGFAEFSSFHRAFKRWTGQSPGSFRCSRQGSAAAFEPH